MRIYIVAGFALLLGCAPQVHATDGAAQVMLYNGGGFAGFSQRILSPDDVLQITSAGPSGKERQSRSLQLRPGAFVAARDHILTQAIPQQALTERAPCMDYGADIVAYRGSDRTVEMRAECPNERLGKLTAEIGAIIAAHHPQGGN